MSHSPLRSRVSSGFTLVEMAVIAPIVILLIGGFISLIVNLTGEVMSSRGSNVLTYDLQDTLNRIEQDVKLSTTFLATNNINVINTKQGFGGTATTGSTTPFTNVDKAGSGGSTPSIILNVLVTDGNPLSADSGLVYLKDQPNPCSTYTEYSKNKPMTANVVYFIDNANTLWRRVIMPENAASTPAVYCGSAPWQVPTCINGYAAGSLPFCKSNDERLIDGISPSDFQFEYFTSASSTFPSATATNPSVNNDLRNTALLSTPTLKVSLTANQTVAGRDISRSASLRATRLDSNATSIAKEQPVTSAPATPTATGTVSAGHVVTFRWPQVAGATSYEASYRINGGAWTGNNSSLTNTDRSYAVSAGNHTDTVELRIRAINSFGPSAYGSSSTTIPLWAPLVLASGWTDYANGYNGAGYTKTNAGFVLFKGLIKKGSTPVINEVISTLPNDYWPEGRLIFSAPTNANVSGRVDVAQNGALQFNTGSGGWYSLESIRYLAASAPQTRTTATLLNGWENYGGTYSAASYVQDSTGRVSVQGLVRNGTNTNETTIFSLPASLNPPLRQHIASRSSAFSYLLLGTSPSGVMATGTGSPSYLSINMSYIPTGASVTWANLALQNSWVNYGGIYSTAQYTKTSDGVVHLKGLIRNGTTPYGTLLATLPAGFRPSGRLILSSANNANFGRIDITAAGQIYYMNNITPSNAWLSLDGMSFVAE